MDIFGFVLTTSSMNDDETSGIFAVEEEDGMPVDTARGYVCTGTGCVIA